MAETAPNEAASSLPVANDLHSSHQTSGKSDVAPSAVPADDSSQLTEAVAPTLNPSFVAVNLHNSADSQHASRATTPQQQHQNSTPARSPSAESSKQKAEGALDESHAGKSSSSAHASDSAMADTATYGTRSRNRTGNARINYAEDQEMDFEYTAAATAANTTATTKKRVATETPTGKPCHVRSTSTRDNIHESVSAEQKAEAHDHFIAVTATATKESTPVVTGSGGGAVGTTKKRKAAANNASTPPASNVHVSASARKLGTAASMGAARETNLMTFSKHKSCLNKRGELVADDGTKLCVNGTYHGRIGRVSTRTREVVTLRQQLSCADRAAVLPHLFIVPFWHNLHI